MHILVSTLSCNENITQVYQRASSQDQIMRSRSKNDSDHNGPVSPMAKKEESQTPQQKVERSPNHLTHTRQSDIRVNKPKTPLINKYATDRIPQESKLPDKSTSLNTHLANNTISVTRSLPSVNDELL